jgi:hypothetical protein
MKYLLKNICLALILSILILLKPLQSFAIEDPLSLPNNKIGIHILFPSELDEAANLINANGGEWGYVVIPIQAGDRDLAKWQEFMDEAKRKKVIPLIRLATEGDYFNTKVWRKPKEEDILDFANFLTSLSWPVKNRYVIIFNEVNRDDEWGGNADPAEYATLLSYAATIFKSRSSDFFIISAGMDNASINGNAAINQFTFLSHMQRAIPGIFYQVDGLSSHAYPNPSFSEPPTSLSKTSIMSFQYEQAFVESLVDKKLPIFITETGWSNERLSEETRATYYQQAFNGVWKDPSIVTIAPFLLRATGGPFEKFSFLKNDNLKTKQYEAIENAEKQKGKPSLNQDRVLSAESKISAGNLPVRQFTIAEPIRKLSRAQTTRDVLFWMFQL